MNLEIYNVGQVPATNDSYLLLMWFDFGSFEQYELTVFVCHTTRIESKLIIYIAPGIIDIQSHLELYELIKTNGIDAIWMVYNTV